MNLFEISDSIIEPFRKRGAIPHQLLSGERAAIVYIRADGWSCGGTAEELKVLETEKHDWRFVWQQGPNGGDVQPFNEYIRTRDGLPGKEDQPGSAESDTLDTQQDHAQRPNSGGQSGKAGLQHKGKRSKTTHRNKAGD